MVIGSGGEDTFGWCGDNCKLVLEVMVLMVFHRW